MTGWQLLLVGLFGGGGTIKLVELWVNRGKPKTDAAGQIMAMALQLLAPYDEKVQTLTERISRLEGKLDRTEEERDAWKSRAHQLERFIEMMELPVPEPLSVDALTHGPEETR